MWHSTTCCIHTWNPLNTLKDTKYLRIYHWQQYTCRKMFDILGCTNPRIIRMKNDANEKDIQGTPSSSGHRTFICQYIFYFFMQNYPFNLIHVLWLVACTRFWQNILSYCDVKFYKSFSIFSGKPFQTSDKRGIFYKNHRLKERLACTFHLSSWLLAYKRFAFNCVRYIMHDTSFFKSNYSILFNIYVTTFLRQKLQHSMLCYIILWHSTICFKYNIGCMSIDYMTIAYFQNKNKIHYRTICWMVINHFNVAIHHGGHRDGLLSWPTSLF